MKFLVRAKPASACGPELERRSQAERSGACASGVVPKAAQFRGRLDRPWLPQDSDTLRFSPTPSNRTFLQIRVIQTHWPGAGLSLFVPGIPPARGRDERLSRRRSRVRVSSIPPVSEKPPVPTGGFFVPLRLAGRAERHPTVQSIGGTKSVPNRG